MLMRQWPRERERESTRSVAGARDIIGSTVGWGEWNGKWIKKKVERKQRQKVAGAPFVIRARKHDSARTRQR